MKETGVRGQLLVILAVTFIVLFQNTAGQSKGIKHDHTEKRTCATMQKFEELCEKNPDYRKKLENYNTTLKSIERLRLFADNDTVVTIPVVVHVVYFSDVENISDEQIFSQISVLNKDFRRQNSDTINTPEEFDSLAADVNIEFCLARTDPDGNPTQGITRTRTSVASFSLDDDVKFTNRGGHDAWDTKRYLNLWVCNISGDILGYAQFPGGPALTDGVVVRSNAFGSSEYDDGNFFLDETYGLGRTTTHEVGHWLHLYHIWGDDTDCSGSDEVDDTPNQEIEYYGCPTYPENSCGSNDMFMNYMDYTDDECMNLFTDGQSERMNNAIDLYRAELKSSNACVIPTTYDAGISRIVSPETYLCSDTIMPVVNLINFGSDTLDSIQIIYGFQPVFDSILWTGTLPSGMSEIINLPSQVINDTSTRLIVFTKYPNNMEDEYPQNDTNSINLIHTSRQITLHLKTDWNAEETSWSILDQEETVLYSGSNYPDNSLIVENFCLQNECYQFIIEDTGSDGICCESGEGYYLLSDESGDTILFSNGEFKASESFDLCVPDSFDLGLAGPEFMIRDICEEEATIELKLVNHGYIEINNLSFQVSIEDIMNESYNWTGTLGKYDTAVYSIDIVLPEGEHIIQASLTSVNETNDEIIENNASSRLAEMTNYSILLHLLTDLYGSEITWELTNSTNEVLAEGGPYPDGEMILYEEIITDLTEACYTLTVFDSYGDGLCCNSGAGYVEGFDFFGEQLFYSDGDFSDLYETDFCLSVIDCNPGIGVHTIQASEPQIYPNPGQSEFYINPPEDSKNEWVVQIFSSDGTLIKQFTINEEAKIDMSKEAKGIYIIHMSSNNQYFLQKLILY